MIVPDNDDIGAWQRIGDTASVEAGAPIRPPRPPSGITPKGYGDPRQITMFAALDDKPPAGVPADVATKFESFALEIADKGFKRYSADAIGHRIRWHEHVERGNRTFKINDHWIKPMAAWFLARHPELPGFFELRERDVTKLDAA
jgi:hypothetical protein